MVKLYYCSVLINKRTVLSVNFFQKVYRRIEELWWPNVVRRAITLQVTKSVNR